MWLSWNATSPFTSNYAWVIARTFNYTDLMDFLVLYKRRRESVMFVRINFFAHPLRVIQGNASGNTNGKYSS